MINGLEREKPFCAIGKMVRKGFSLNSCVLTDVETKSMDDYFFVLTYTPLARVSILPFLVSL